MSKVHAQRPSGTFRIVGFVNSPITITQMGGEQPMLYKSIAAYALVAITIIISFSFFIWPTPYNYEKLSYGKYQVLVSINRITGTTHILDLGTWREADYSTTQLNRREQTSAPKKLPEVIFHNTE